MGLQVHGAAYAALAAAIAALVLAPEDARAAPRRPARRAPAWTRHAAGPCPRPFSPKLLCAVGKAEGVASPALGRAAAATRARTELARALQRGRRAGPPAVPPGEGEATSEALAGSVILAVHRARGGAWFALAAIAAPEPER